MYLSALTCILCAMGNKTYATNKKAKFDYELQDSFIAGLVLAGHEAKSIRAGNASLKGAYVTISENGEAWLTNAHIKQYQHATTLSSYDPEQSRKLLLNKSEIERLIRARNEKLVIVPLSIHAAGPNIKLSIAIARPKKRFDKRHSIKKRDVERESQRHFKS